MPEVTRKQIVEAARSYIGVPYVAGGQDRSGVNCAGLLIAVGRDLGLSELEFEGRANFSKDLSLDGLFSLHMDKLPDWRDAREADVVSIAYENDPEHCVIVTKVDWSGIYGVHARRKYGVIEHRFYGRLLTGATAGYRVRGKVD
ncbi:MAG TPA: hypothetical protein VGB17_06970 [Pyrinomonadaceae bacterium]|jgi:hypothetical protein